MGSVVPESQIVIIDLGASADEIAPALQRACHDLGFFYLVGTGIDFRLTEELETLSREFFARPLSEKLLSGMAHGGRAWRGYFPVGGELTSGEPDAKEGLYFGAELSEHHPKVVARVPLHGRNVFPENVPGFREVVLEYIDAMTALGHRLMEALSMSLGLAPTYLHQHFTSDPLVLFRIFNYPPLGDRSEAWSVGEHTDYGLLTILLQDDSGGLQVRTRSGWVDAPPIPGAFVCNLGDMLERMTGGHYRSTPHRVRNVRERDRLSFPFFFDPGWDAKVAAIEPRDVAKDDGSSRWDKTSVHTFTGTYGEYLLGKVSRVFPDLRDEVL